MNSQKTTIADFVVVGAGILGLSIASELYERFPTATIIVLEKEKSLGLHASGRNSGVLHSGIYYPPGSLKAKLCADGAQKMRAYCKEYQLPCHQLGKVIIPTKVEDSHTLQMLYQRGLQNGVKVEYIDNLQLQELEPATNSPTGHALFVPTTSVVDPFLIVQHLYNQLQAKGVRFLLNENCTNIDTVQQRIQLKSSTLSYKHLVNTAGLYADKIADRCGISNKYTMIPFKGIYYELNPASNLAVNRLIYPVPDMNVPFLGVHFTKSVYGKIYVGPTAIPALGREQYRGLNGLKITEALGSMYHLMIQYKLNQQGFRVYTHNEVSQFLKSKFVNAAKLLMPAMTANDLVLSKKVGIRAQLLDISSRQLVMDFLIEQTQNETHILNAVSPAFTSAFSFSEKVVSLIESKFAVAI